MVHICLNNGKTELMPCEFKKKQKKTKRSMRKWSTGFNAIERSGEMKTEKCLLGLAIWRSLTNLARGTISIE